MFLIPVAALLVVLAADVPRIGGGSRDRPAGQAAAVAEPSSASAVDAPDGSGRGASASQLQAQERKVAQLRKQRDDVEKTLAEMNGKLGRFDSSSPVGAPQTGGEVALGEIGDEMDRVQEQIDGILQRESAQREQQAAALESKLASDQARQAAAALREQLQKEQAVGAQLRQRLAQIEEWGITTDELVDLRARAQAQAQVVQALQSRYAEAERQAVVQGEAAQVGQLAAQQAGSVGAGPSLGELQARLGQLRSQYESAQKKLQESREEESALESRFQDAQRDYDELQAEYQRQSAILEKMRSAR